MPTYEYVCQKCAHPFEIQRSLAEYAKVPPPKCPRCGSTRTIRVFGAVNVSTASRSAGRSTVGCGPGCDCR